MVRTDFAKNILSLKRTAEHVLTIIGKFTNRSMYCSTDHRQTDSLGHESQYALHSIINCIETEMYRLNLAVP